jgi:hypothetical protein
VVGVQERQTNGCSCFFLKTQGIAPLVEQRVFGWLLNDPRDCQEIKQVVNKRYSSTRCSSVQYRSKILGLDGLTESVFQRQTRFFGWKSAGNAEIICKNWDLGRNEASDDWGGEGSNPYTKAPPVLCVA